MIRFLQGKAELMLPTPGSRAQVTYPGSGEKAWQEQDKLTGTKADSQARSLHKQDGEEEHVGAEQSLKHETWAENKREPGHGAGASKSPHVSGLGK